MKREGKRERMKGREGRKVERGSKLEEKRNIRMME